MDSRQLKTFIAVAECGSFSKAEEQEYISKQALLKQINNLETEVGVSLFRRSVSGVELTQEGRIFLDGARKLTEDMHGLVLSCRRPANYEETLRLSNVEHQKLITPVLNVFIRKNPDVHINYIIHPNHSGEFRVQEGLMDIAETFRDPDFAPGRELMENAAMRYTRLCDFPYMAVMSPKHPLAKNRSVSFAQLADYPVDYFKFITRRQVSEQLQTVFFDRPDALNCRMDIDNQIAVTFECAESDKILVSCNPYIYYMENIVRIPLECDVMQEYGIITSASPSSAAQKLADMARFMYNKYGMELIVRHSKFR